MNRLFLLVALFINLGLIQSQKINLDLIPFRDGNKWGYHEFKGSMRIEAKYDTTTFFVNCHSTHPLLGLVKQNNKWGIIDVFDNTIIPIIYDKLELPLYGYDSLIIASINGKFGIINHDNKTVVPFKYKWIQEDNNYQQQRNNDPAFRFIALNLKDQICYISPEGKSTLKENKKPKITEIELEPMGDYESASVAPPVDDTPRLFKPNADSLKKYGIDSISSFPFNPIYYFLYKNGKKGVYNCRAIFNEQDYLMPPQFDELIYYNNLRFVVKRNDSIAVMNFPNMVLMPYSKLDKVTLNQYNYDFILTEKDKKFGVYHTYTKEHIDPIYEQIIPFYFEGTTILLVTKNGKDGWLTTDLVEYFKN